MNNSIALDAVAQQLGLDLFTYQPGDVLLSIRSLQTELALHNDPPGFSPFWVLLDENKYEEAETMLREFQNNFPGNLSLIGADTQLIFWTHSLDSDETT